ncbi:hypothetical protein ACP4OV_016340 [Aristida adscensionis]
MDGCGGWSPFRGGSVVVDGDTPWQYTASNSSCGSGLRREAEEHDVVISSPVHQQLKEIYMLMDMELEHGEQHAAPAPPQQGNLDPSSTSSSTFRQSFSGSPDENSSLMLTSSSTNASCHHHLAEVSSLQMPLPSPIAYGGGDHHVCNNFDGTIPDLEELLCNEVPQDQEQQSSSHVHGGAGHGAFRPYVRQLSPRKKPKPGGGSGQLAIKSAMSVLVKMHMVRLAQWQSYSMEMAVPPSAGSGSNNGNQLQHVLSERKRREKLNDSFNTLRAVLPPGPKKDKSSILIRARDHINALKCRVSELEEKNKMLTELQLQRDEGDEDDYDSCENIEVDISRTTTKETLESSQEFHVKIVVRSGFNAMDVVLGTLQRLKEIGDVSLVAMDTGSSGPRPGQDFRQATMTLQLKSCGFDDDFIKDSVRKTVKGVMQSKIETA